MSESEQYSVDDFWDDVAAAALATFRWVMLVVAIAVGTFLGLFVFAQVLSARIENAFHQEFEHSPFATATYDPTTTPSRCLTRIRKATFLLRRYHLLQTSHPNLDGSPSV